MDTPRPPCAPRTPSPRKPLTSNRLTASQRAAQRRSDTKAARMLDVTIVRTDPGSRDEEMLSLLHPESARRAGFRVNVQRGLSRGLSTILQPLFGRAHGVRKTTARRAVLPSLIAADDLFARDDAHVRLRRVRSETSRLRKRAEREKENLQDGGRGVGARKEGSPEAISVDTDWKSLFARYGASTPALDRERATPVSSSGSKITTPVMKNETSDDCSTLVLATLEDCVDQKGKVLADSRLVREGV